MDIDEPNHRNQQSTTPAKQDSLNTLVFAWMVANAVAWAIGFLIVVNLDPSKPFNAIPDILALGLPLALGQWLTLRTKIVKSRQFLFLSFLGAAVGVVVGAVFLVFYVQANQSPVKIDNLGEYFWFGLPWGIGISFYQWLYWRSKSRRSSLWLLINPIAIVFAVEVFQALYTSLVQINNLLLRAAIPGLIGGATYGGITISLLLWLVQHPSEPKPAPSKFRLYGQGILCAVMGIGFALSTFLFAYSAFLTKFPKPSDPADGPIALVIILGVHTLLSFQVSGRYFVRAGHR